MTFEPASSNTAPEVFVTIEGIEGSGKSTLLSGLADALRAAGRTVVVTREPGGTALGDAVRSIFLEPALTISPLAEAMLVNAARAQHVTSIIAPALERGAVVICDRFVDSTLAYQGYGRGVDLSVLNQLCAIATGGLAPDLTLLIDLPVELSRDRTRARGERADRIEADSDGFHRRVREGFLALASQSPRFCVLDGTLPVSVLLERAMAAVAGRLERAVP